MGVKNEIQKIIDTIEENEDKLEALELEIGRHATTHNNQESKLLFDGIKELREEVVKLEKELGSWNV